MMPEQITAFCPGHISGYFKPVLTGDPLTSGSMGAGVVISEGVTVTVRRADTISVKIFQNTPEYRELLISEDSPVIRYLLEEFRFTAQIETRSSLPLSAGYGLSAAAILATIHAINQLERLGMSPGECALKAHSVEILHRTGLGDVSACQGGGWNVRSRPGPQAGIIRFYTDTDIYALTLGPIKTSSILSSPEDMKRIEAAFPEEIPRDPMGIIRNSRRFAENSGLISQEVRKVLTECDANDIPSSMTMLGNGVFGYGRGALHILSRFGTTYELHPAKNGPIILERP